MAEPAASRRRVPAARGPGGVPARGADELRVALPAGSRARTVACGREVAFGRSADGAPDDRSAAGRIRATDGYWLISNLSATRTYVVENQENPVEYVRVPPGRLDMPVPFTCSRTVLPSPTGPVSFTVTAPAPAYLDPPPQAHEGERAPAGFALDAGTKYFLVLVALCEPRLREPATVAIPSTPEVVTRLRALRSCRGITGAAVNFHVDYIARRKLRVREERTTPGAGQRVTWQREAIVTTALRFGVVRVEHLELLGPD